MEYQISKDIYIEHLGERHYNIRYREGGKTYKRPCLIVGNVITIGTALEVRN